LRGLIGASKLGGGAPMGRVLDVVDGGRPAGLDDEPVELRRFPQKLRVADARRTGLALSWSLLRQRGLGCGCAGRWITQDARDT
jgi:hypothetical protein